jgi:hypothetical protein
VASLTDKLDKLTGMVNKSTEIVAGLTEMIFKFMHPPDEWMLHQYMVANGGPEAVLKDDQLLKDMLAKAKPAKSEVMAKQPRDNSTLSVKDLREKLKPDVETMISENVSFDKKFEEQRRQLEDVVKRESDRVIETVLAGPHEHILNPASPQESG